MSRRRREMFTKTRSRRSGSVWAGSVETVNSVVVGEGRRTCRCGAVVSILAERRRARGQRRRRLRPN